MAEQTKYWQVAGDTKVYCTACGKKESYIYTYHPDWETLLCPECYMVEKLEKTRVTYYFNNGELDWCTGCINEPKYCNYCKVYNNQ